MPVVFMGGKKDFADALQTNKVDISAMWPASIQVAPLPIPDIDLPAPGADFQATPGAQDVPVGVGVLIAGSYAALIGAFALATVASAQSAFMVTIAALFVLAFFTVPRIFLHVEPKATPRTGFQRFMREGIDTLTGHSSGAATLVQMMIVPVLLTFAALAMGIAASIYL